MNAIIAADLDEMKKLGFKPDQLEKIDDLMGPLCQTMRLYLARFFVRAHIARFLKKGPIVIPFETALSAAKSQWEEVWSKGTPDRLGDPDDVATIPDTGTCPAGWGMRNAEALLALYKKVGLPLPKFLF